MSLPSEGAANAPPPAISSEASLTPPTRGRVVLRTLLSGLGYGLFLLALISVAFVALGLKPSVALPALWVGAFGDSADGHLYPLSETLVKTSPLLLTGLGVVVSWRAGLFSIGGEGQLLMGALAATAAAKWGARLPGPLLTMWMLLVGTLAGAVWGAIAGWLRVRRNVQEVISTIMLNYIALYLLGAMVEGPLQEQGRRLSQSDPIPDAALFARLLPRAWSGGIATRLHSGILLAFLAAGIVYVLLFHTSFGFGLRVVGQNADAARAARFPIDRLRLRALAISGGLCGMAGAVELLGIAGRLYANFSPGWGYTAIPVALLGGLHPLGTVAAALFFGALTAGSGNLERFSGVSSVLINVIQAAAVLAVVGARAWRTRKLVNNAD